jgi:large repetitive protein
LPVPKPNDPHVDFQVRYEDNMAVRISSFTSSNIRVTGPTGQVLTVTYVSSDVSTDGTPRIATHTLKVLYVDDQAINVSTLDSRDIRVTGPNRFNVLAKLKGVDQRSNGLVRVATYEISAPRGGW